MKNRGMTLIEIIIVIVVLSIAMLPLLIMFSNVVAKSAEGQFVPTATLLGQDLIEEIESKRYDENTDPPWTVTLGPEEATRDDYDDVDDFKGYSEDPISGYPNYSSSVDVYYVEPGDLNTEVTGPTDFKKIIVTISHTQIGDIELVTVMQGY
ncbi:MAG: prepilin-type N-terminal cleavage/methylation domain-containing protein [bacterium]